MFSATPDTQLFEISTNKTREINIKITFKNNIFTRRRTLIVTEHNPLKRLHQFDHRNQVHLLTLFSAPIICYFKVLYACLGGEGGDKNNHLIKVNNCWFCGSILMSKKASLYLKSLKYYFKVF